MIDSFRNIFAIPDLRRRVIFTFALLAVYRIEGRHAVAEVDLPASVAIIERRPGRRVEQHIACALVSYGVQLTVQFNVFDVAASPGGVILVDNEIPAPPPQ